MREIAQKFHDAAAAAGFTLLDKDPIESDDSTTMLYENPQGSTFHVELEDHGPLVYLVGISVADGKEHDILGLEHDDDLDFSDAVTVREFIDSYLDW